MRPSKLWPAAAMVLGAVVAGCSGGSTSPTVASVGAGPTTTVAQAGGSSSSDSTPLAKALAYAHCMRSHGMASFPDPVQTPDGGYGFRTTGIDPHSAAFKAASSACDALVPGGWGSSGRLSPAQQQQWLDWATCIRAHGVPNFADPTFSGDEVHITDGGRGSSAQMQSAMDACKSQKPSAGGVGG